MVEQSMDVAFVIAHKLREGKERKFGGVNGDGREGGR
jgi:hypothetical protein